MNLNMFYNALNQKIGNDILTVTTNDSQHNFYCEELAFKA